MSLIRLDHGPGASRASATARSVVTAVADVRRIPTGSLVGLIVIGFGLGADLVVHLGPGLGHDHGASEAQLSAHLVTFVGMVLVLAGVVVSGLRSNRRR